MGISHWLSAAAVAAFLIGCGSSGGSSGSKTDGEVDGGFTNPPDGWVESNSSASIGKGLAFVSYSGDENQAKGYFVEVNLTNGSLTTLYDYSEVFGKDFVVGADIINGTMTGITNSGKKLYAFGSDGSANLLKEYTLSSDVNMTGLAFDDADNRLFLSDFDVDKNISYLIEVDTTDYTVKHTYPIHDGNATTMLIGGIACDANATMYGIDIFSDKLLTIDVDSGNVTVAGPLGIDINFAQDIAYNRNDHKIYGTLFIAKDNKDPNATGALYTIDKNGTAVKVGDFSSEAVELAGFGITQ